jgi:hypothetical protein
MYIRDTCRIILVFNSCLSPLRPGSNPGPVNVRSVLDTVALALGSLTVLLGFTLSPSFHHYSTLVFILVLLLGEGQKEKWWLLSSRGISGRIGKKRNFTLFRFVFRLCGNFFLSTLAFLFRYPSTTTPFSCSKLLLTQGQMVAHKVTTVSFKGHLEFYLKAVSLWGVSFPCTLQQNSQ